MTISTNQNANSLIPSLHAQLKADLRTAMKARKEDDIAILRSTLAAIDNAGAVETNRDTVPLTGFTDDVPRKMLTEEEVRVIIQCEAEELQLAITRYQELGIDGEVPKLRAQRLVLARYLQQ